MPRVESLVRAVETEVIPRLLAAHRAPPSTGRLPGLADVEQLCGHALASDADAGLRLVATLGADGVGLEAIYVNLLGASARTLGEMWEQDRITFVDVTVALCTLHQILFKLAPEPPRPVDGRGSGGPRRAFFTPVPGEDHVFGTLIVARFFTRAGWQTWTEASTNSGTLVDRISAGRFDLVGLSIACDRHREALAATVREIRAACQAPAPFILVGGNLAERMPGLASAVGADGAATDPLAAVQIAETLLDKREANV